MGIVIPENQNSDVEIGVIVGRFQVPALHKYHKELIEYVCDNHPNVILFIGVPVVGQTSRNPLDFATRKAMIQELYPTLIILPLKDQRVDEHWSQILDDKISEVFTNKGVVLYGSRDSFIPHYKGRHNTIELVSDDNGMSGTLIRSEVARNIINSDYFRSGVIYANHGRYPVIMPCADIVVYNPKDESILLGRKPNENKFRFIGGHVEVSDNSYEAAAIKELSEGAPGISIVEGAYELTYICSGKIDDWRHAKESSKIFSTLFLATMMSGKATAADDIEEVKWFKISDFTQGKYSNVIISEHIPFFTNLMRYFKNDQKISGYVEVKSVVAGMKQFKEWTTVTRIVASGLVGIEIREIKK